MEMLETLTSKSNLANGQRYYRHLSTTGPNFHSLHHAANCSHEMGSAQSRATQLAFRREIGQISNLSFKTCATLPRCVMQSPFACGCASRTVATKRRSG